MQFIPINKGRLEKIHFRQIKKGKAFFGFKIAK